jgi:hypothetical protein
VEKLNIKWHGYWLCMDVASFVISVCMHITTPVSLYFLIMCS